MPTFPLRIRFVDADHAYKRFHSFPPDDLDYIEGWSRKRDGDSQMILLHLTSEAHMQDFLALCQREGSIVEVIRITEGEFRKAKSNAMKRGVEPHSELPGAFSRPGDVDGKVKPSELVDWYVAQRQIRRHRRAAHPGPTGENFGLDMCCTW